MAATSAGESLLTPVTMHFDPRMEISQSMGEQSMPCPRSFSTIVSELVDAAAQLLLLVTR